MGLPFICIASDADESFDPKLDAKAVAEDLALRKVRKVARDIGTELKHNWILAADTVISLEGKIYGKAEKRDEAKAMLRAFSGKSHEVITAIALYNRKKDNMDCISCPSMVSFAEITEAEIEWYLDTGEWQDAAGSYKIQGLASCFIKDIKGSYSSIVGLPLREIYVMLRENGYPYGAGYPL